MSTYNSSLQAESTRSELKYEAFIEFVIESIPFVESCTVLSKSHDIEGKTFIAFIVASAPTSDAQLRKHLESRLPAHLFPQAFVPLTTFPLTPEGLVDRQALDHIEIIDDSLVQAWQNQLLSLEGVEQAVVIEAEPYEKLVPLHLSDVISDWDMLTSSNALAVDPSADIKPTSAPPDREILSISHGVSLQIPKAFSGTIIDFLLCAATEHPDHGIVYIQDDGTSVFQGYDVLKQEAGSVLSGLRQLGLKPQDKVLFQLEQAQDFLPAFWGCILGGFVPVPLSVTVSNRDKDNATRKLEQAWQQLNRPLVLTSQSQLIEVCAAGQTFAQEDFKVSSIEALRSQEPDLNWHHGQSDDVAILLLTSGSTGVPKAVMQSHRSIIALTSGFIQMHDFTDQDICVNWMPLDHVGGIVMCHLRDTLLGAQQIQVSTDFILQKPLRWLDLIDQYRATFTWAPNFAYELINNLVPDATQRSWDLSSMRFMLTGGEAVSAKTSRTVLKRLGPYGLPATAIRPAWGMSETCSGTIFSDNFTLATTQDDDQFVEVGLPMPGFSIRITNTQKQVVPEHTIGHLEVKGPTVTSGYFQNDAATQSSFTEDGWLKTGDLAVLKNGRLTITGREKDIIIINGVNFHSHEIEEVIQEVPSIESSYTAACSVRIAGDNSDKLVVFFHPKENLPLELPVLIKEIREKISTKMGINPHYLIPVEKEAIPKTSIGKIQRSQLKQRFEEGKFNSIIKRLDIAEENSNTIPSWFLKKSWHRKEIVNLMPSIKKGFSLVFIDKLSLGKTVCEELIKSKKEFIIVDSGNNFDKISRTHYVLNPSQRQDYIDLIQHLKSENISISKILHLWTYDELVSDHIYDSNKLNLDLEQGIYSILFLVQALDRFYSPKASVNDEIDLLVVSSYCQSVRGEDPLAPGKATLLGLIKALSKEIGWLNCRHVDTPSTFDRHIAKNIIKEIFGKLSEQEVCYRNNQRFIPFLQKVDFAEDKKNDFPLKNGGFYLVSGGLGGVGIEITRYLLEQYQAKILLIGRASVATLENEIDFLNNSGMDSIKSKKYIELQNLPGEIQYKNIDICNATHLHETVKYFEAHWESSLDGIIHLAGIYQENVILKETKDSVASVLRPKVLGTLSLHQLLKDRPDCLFIQFSSVTGFFGGSMIGAYAAANCFQECFAHFQKRMQLQSYCFNWSSWKDTGMSKSSVAGEALVARGYRNLSVKQGLNSFLVGLCLDQTALMIGLDSNNRNIRQSMQRSPYLLKVLTGYLKTRNNRLPDTLSRLEVKDRYQTISTCHFQILPEMPVTQTGEIDYQALSLFKVKNSSKWIEPSSKVELKLATIWKNLLCIDQISIHDNFFSVGGSSLLGVQLLNRIEEELSIKLSSSILFEAPTIAQQAQFIQNNDDTRKEVPNRQDNPSSDSSILLLKSGNLNTPLFFAPGGGAVDVDFLMYAPLFQSLDEDQSVYVLEARSFDPSGNRYIRVEDMAKDYADEIQTIQPEGPYFLGGECIGGVLALEIGRQLQQRGHKIALITMLDTGLPQKYTYFRHLIRSQYKIFNRKLNQYINRAQKLLHSTKKTIVSDLQKKLSESNLEITQQTVLKGRKSYSLKEKNFRVSLMFCHQSKPYDGSITILINEARFHERYTERTGPEWTNYRYKNDPSLGWKKVVKQGIDIQVVPGNHDSYIREYSKETARILQSRINKAKK